MSKGPADTHLARAVYTWRTSNGLSQPEAARRLGIGYRSLQDYERGVTERPHPMNLNRMAAVMGTTSEELLAGPRGEDNRREVDAQVAKAIEDVKTSMLREIKRLRKELEEAKRPRREPRSSARRPARRSKS